MIELIVSRISINAEGDVELSCAVPLRDVDEVKGFENGELADVSPMLSRSRDFVHLFL